MQAKSSFGTIAIDEGLVVIERRAVSGLAKDVRSVLISSLAGVDLRRATAWEPGYLRLIYPGASSGVAGNLRLYDPDTIMFNVEDQEAMLDVYDALMTFVSGKPHVTPRRKPPPISPVTIAVVSVAALLCAAAIGLGLYFRV